MARNLTEKQRKFLDVLFEEAQGSPVKALKLAGYAHGISSTSILNSLQDEVAELTKVKVGKARTSIDPFAFAGVQDPLVVII